MFRESIEKIINNCDGAVAGVVMGFDGIEVDKFASSKDVDVQTISMEFSVVLGEIRKAAKLLEVGELEEVSVRSEELTYIIRVLNKEYFLGVVMMPGGNFGKGRFLMRMAVPDLRAEL
jgi:predicted regulator of Ras-like GTPase activity (Roadblock/LC7/MglB family)